MEREIKKAYWLSLNLILLYPFLFSLLAYNHTLHGFKIPNWVIYVMGIVLMVITPRLSNNVLQLFEKQKEAEKAALRLEEATQLIELLRRRNHDFINHLQVIMGLIQLGRESDALKFVRDLSDTLLVQDKINLLERPEVAALISRKLAGVSYLRPMVTVDTSLKTVPVSSEKLVAIIGNLLDNAIYAASFFEDKWVKIHTREQGNWFVVEITNPGAIPQAIREKVFEPGFTTKGKKGSGMGLVIVKDTVEGFGGCVSFTCDYKNNTTMFSVSIPKSQAYLSRAVYI